jgi:site-specific DNA-methyltransferase (adenine-specific)
MIRIYNEDCLRTIERLDDASIDCVVTSPPYNTTPHLSEGTNRTVAEVQRDKGYYVGLRYDGYCDSMPNDKYADFCASVFDGLSRKVKPNGTIIWNVSIGAENTSALFVAVAEILKRGNWIVGDKLVWKKRTAIPLNTSRNLSTRICEDVFVFCRPHERVTFHANKKAVSQSPSGQWFYETPYNIIDAENNDGATMLNRATFSTDFARQCLERYAPRGGVVYDPVMGTGTTASAARDLGMDCIGSEISAAQCEYAKRRLEDMFTQVEIIKE